MLGKTESEGFRGSLPARRTNPEGWQVAWWPALNFPSMPHALQPRELAFVEKHRGP